MKAIVAVDKDWGIGKNGQLLFHIKEDMKFFKEMTIGKVVVMGRKTFESLPDKKPLKDRTNLIITSAISVHTDNLFIDTLDKIMEKLKEYDTNDIFIIGGESIYKQLIDYCNEAYITRVDYSYEADTFMPDLTEEGFIFEKIIDNGKTEDGKYWSIEKWVGCF